MLLALLARLGVHHLAQPLLDRALLLQRDLVEHVDHLVIPAALLRHLRVDLCQCGPDPQVAIRDHCTRSVHAATLQVS